jgi:hypothetical protein
MADVLVNGNSIGDTFGFSPNLGVDSAGRPEAITGPSDLFMAKLLADLPK